MTSAGGTKAELKYSDMNSALLLSRFPELSGRINSELEINGELPYVLISARLQMSVTVIWQNSFCDKSVKKLFLIFSFVWRIRISGFIFLPLISL